MANSQRKPLKKYKDNKNNLTKWEQELDEKLKDHKGFWQHLEEIQRDHPRPSYSFDGNDFFLEQEEDKIKLSKDFEEKKKYMEFDFETYLRQEKEGEGKEDDKESNENADDGWQKFPTLTGFGFFKRVYSRARNFVPVPYYDMEYLKIPSVVPSGL